MVFVGDNGTPGQATETQYTGPHAKGTLYQGGVHVPLCIASPATAAGGRTSDALVHVADVFATVLDLFGAAAPAGVDLDSLSLQPLLESTAGSAARSWLYTEAFGTMTPDGNAGRAARDEHFKRVRLDGTADALHDLDGDPHEESDLLLSGGLDGVAQAACEALGEHLDTLK